MPEELWRAVEALLPPPPSQAKGGRPPIGDRQVLTGILFVLRSGIPWRDLPLELGCGSGMTCLRRLRYWQSIALWEKIQAVVERFLDVAHRIDWARAYALDREEVRRRGARLWRSSPGYRCGLEPVVTEGSGASAASVARASVNEVPISLDASRTSVVGRPPASVNEVSISLTASEGPSVNV